MPANTSTPENQVYPQYSILKVFGLSVLSGIMVALVFIVLTPVVSSFDFPPLLAFLLAVLVREIAIPIGEELYFLWFLVAPSFKIQSVGAGYRGLFFAVYRI